MVNNGWGRIVGLALALVVLAMVPIVIGWGNLPDPFASHWGLDGRPDANLPMWTLPLLPVVLIVVGGLIATLFRVRGRPSAEGAGLLLFMGTTGVLATASTVMLNSGAEDWQAASPMHWSHIAAVLVVPALVGVLGYLVARGWYPMERSETFVTTNAIPVSPGEAVTWVGTSQVRYPFVIAAVGTLGMVLLPGVWRLATIPVVAAALILSHVKVTVDNEGLKASLGGIFRRRFPLSEIYAVKAVELIPNEWGGWGYRTAPGRTAMVVRGGEAIDIQLTNGHRFAVNVDDAATGAGLLKGLLQEANVVS